MNTQKVHRFLVKSEVKFPLWRFSADMAITLKGILKKYYVKIWSGLIWLTKGPVLGFYEHANKHACCIESEHLSNCHLFKIDSDACN